MATKLLLTFLIILSSLSLYAQQPAPADSAVFPPPPTAPAKEPASISSFYFSAEFTFNALSGLPNAITNNIIGSMGFAFNVQRKFFIVKKNFYFSTGLGVATYDYANNAFFVQSNPNNKLPRRDTVSLAPIPGSVNYSKNKLNLVWLQVPLELHIQTNPNAKGNKFEFEFGARLGYLINAHTKQKGIDSSGNTYKVKVYEIPDMNQFSTMLTAKVGYDHVNLFAYYNLYSLFSVSNNISAGPSPYELGAGIALTF